MLTWLLAGSSLVLSLTFGPGAIATGTATGLTPTPCAAYGVVQGTRIAVTVQCVQETGWVPFVSPPFVQTYNLVLDVHPATLGGTWVSNSGHGTLVRQ